MRLALLAVLAAAVAAAQTAGEKLDRLMAQAAWPGTLRSALGVTRHGTTIPTLLAAADLDYTTTKTRVLLIGGLDGSGASVDAVVEALRWFYTDPGAAAFRRQFALSAVPVANPDGWFAGSGPSNLSGGDPTRGYPPPGDAYSSPTNPEAAYLWRWIGMHAPDLVVDVRWGAAAGERVPDELFPSLSRAAPAGTGTIPPLLLWTTSRQFLPRLLERGPREPSPARREIQRRLARSPDEVARQLGARYGHELDQVVYIPAMALIGRLRLGEVADVERIVAPYFDGRKPSLPQPATGSHLSGHLVFGELARLTGKARYVELVRAAADLGFDEGGAPKPSMPFHNEMSDAVFMGCPILAQAGRLTGERKYFDMALRHMRFMLGLNLRPDGLHRHSPLDPAAWGRGNGFPALGLALSLSEFPLDHPGRDEMLRAFRAHMEAVAPHQDLTGAWRQVIDHAGSYRELTATSMIAFAMIRGVRQGWLEPARYRPLIEKAWYAVRTRVAPDGSLVDVCTGTGKQKSLRDYLDRTAILGPDPRGGAMALLLATEIAQWERERK